MTTAEHFGSVRAHHSHYDGSAIAPMWRTIDALRRWRRMRQAIVELRELDDRLLDDIGLSRSTLFASVRERHGFGKRGFRGFEGC